MRLIFIMFIIIKMSLRYKNLDDFVIKFSEKILLLQKCENSNAKNKCKTIFNKLLNDLNKRDKFGIDQNLWYELYFDSVYFYSFINQIGDIPTTLVTKHNNILTFYM